MLFRSMENMGVNIDYDKIAKIAYDVTGASYVSFNLFDDNGKEYTTVALQGITENIKKGLKLFNINLVGRKWPYDPVLAEKIKGQDITYFSSLSELANSVISSTIIEKLEKGFKIGNIVVAKITKEGKSVGQFVLVFQGQETISNIELFKLYL